MSQLNRIEKILGDFTTGEAITSHNGVVCYPAMRNNTDEKYILKVISVPASSVQLAALLLSGAYSSREDALAYFKGLANEIQREARAMNELSNQEGFVPFLTCRVLEKEDTNGYEVYLLSPYQHSLEQIFSEDIMTHQGIMDLAMDLCSALAACRRAGYLYIDLKPGNIFYDPSAGYRIGDLGLLSLSSLKYASLPDKYRSIYTAPEISDAISQLNSTLDVYALGLILYQAYNGGKLPMEDDTLADPLLPPLYADYEMAQIILTACHCDPEKRWSDPTALGQALVQYMQNYGVTDGSIVPAPVATPELDVGEEFLPDEEISDPSEWEDIPELAFMRDLVSDETAPTMENTSDLSDGTVSEETNEILAQADELIAHETPDPVVTPDPLPLIIPDPIILPDDPIEEIPVEDSVAEEAAVEDTSVEDTEAERQFEEPEETREEESEQEETDEPDTAEDMEPAEEEVVSQNTSHPQWGKKILRPLIIAAVLALLIALGAGIYRSYTRNYLHTIDSLTLSGTVDTIIVRIETEMDETLLTVTCSDTYGNSTTATVSGGIATFTGLSPQTRYTIRVSVDGMHKLSGKTSDSFTTASQTNVSGLTATIGPADGSVYLNFTVDGVECDEWLLTYSAPDMPEQTLSFAGHSVTVYDLSIGSEYTFTLSSADGSSVIGQTQITYVARSIIRAENPVITACGNGILTVQWELPAGEAVTQWTVRCFNAAGYDQTITTENLAWTFTELTHDTPCTVEITAEGMPQSVSITIGANPINITAVRYESYADGNLLLHWEFIGTIPEGGWIVNWSCDGSAPVSVNTAENSVIIPHIPNGNYTVSLIAADGTPVFGHTASFTVEQAQSFAGYGITADNLQFMMCTPPNTDSWEWDSLEQDAYKNIFLPGETAGFVVWCNTAMEMPEEETIVTFILRDESGTLVCVNATSHLWNAMWDQGFCELNIPEMPTASGSYCLWIYFNGMLAGIQDFSIQ